MNKKYLSIDIGGTRIKYGLIDDQGAISQEAHQDTPTENLGVFLTAIFDIVQSFEHEIKGIGISVPGKVDAAHNTIYHGGSLPFLNELPLASLLMNQFSLPVNVENDGKCSALGEYWQGNLMGKDNSMAIVLGTAVGSGMILDGHLRQGAHMQACEISFTVNPSDTDHILMGDQCSAVQLVKDLAHALNLSSNSDGRPVFSLLKRKNNELANHILDTYCFKIAAMIINIQSLCDLTDYVIGGGISNQAIVIERINTQYDQLVAQYPDLSSTIIRPKIQATRFGNRANLFGAMYSLLSRMDIN